VKKIPVILCAALLSSAALSTTQDVFDRSAEVEKYLVKISDGTRIVLTQTARDIQKADLSDERLAAALFDKLATDAPKLSDKNKVDVRYRLAMTAALASTGSAEFASRLKKLCNDIESLRRQGDCEEEVARMPWYKTKNEIAANKKFHKDGDNERSSRLMNLVTADDFMLKKWAAELMDQEKIADLRLMDATAEQVLRYMDSTTHSASRAQVDAIGYFVRVLGNSGHAKYRDVIDKVLASNAGPIVQMRAREAKKRLR